MTVFKKVLCFIAGKLGYACGYLAGTVYALAKIAWRGICKLVHRGDRKS